jgi:hypothetical protein
MSKVEAQAAIERIAKRMKPNMTDSEDFHFRFDQELELRLMELDPEFMLAMSEYYTTSGYSRWYA